MTPRTAEQAATARAEMARRAAWAREWRQRGSWIVLTALGAAAAYLVMQIPS